MWKRPIVPILGLLLTALAGCAAPGRADVERPAEGTAPLNARQLPVATFSGGAEQPADGNVPLNTQQRPVTTFSDDAENARDEGVSGAEVAGPPRFEPQGSASATPAAVSTVRFFVPTIT